MKKILAFILATLMILSVLAGCTNKTAQTTEEQNTKTSNPCEAEFLTDEMKTMLGGIKRVDEEGYLYELSYTYDYYDPTVLSAAGSVLQADSGCSAFATYNTDGDFVLARNYDYNHPDENNNSTGLNLVIKTAPEGKLKSIAVCDAYWLNQKSYFNGRFDDGKTDVSNVIVAPYLCVDGLNEAGVSAALLALDTKPGETTTNQNTGKEKVTHMVLLRYILDNAKSLDEAIELAKGYDILSTSNCDLHIIVADKSGNSAVLEWRQYTGDTEQKLYVTYTNAITNFLVGFDDAQDMYREDGSLREIFAKVENTVNEYHYGYGHGYHRFCGIVSAMDRYIAEDALPNTNGVRYATMMNSQIFNILSVAAQEPGLEKTSLTQYSAIFDMTKSSLTICSERDFTKSYNFTIG